MPELPEVETVRLGLATHLTGRRILDVRVDHPRAVRGQPGGAAELTGRLRGRRIAEVARRGKYLWLVTDAEQSGAGEQTPAYGVVMHLGMSGQLLIAEPGLPEPNHLRILAELDDGNTLRFVDQRTFGGWRAELLADGPNGLGPAGIAHIARDPFDPDFDSDRVITEMRRKRTEIKRALLDQELISGVGNIYAAEALWRSGSHGARRPGGLSRPVLEGLIGDVTAVMEEALAQGGTSFDALYVNVNGESGYFERSLNVYGREGEPCRRCGAAIAREKWTNRSSYYCPACQPRPKSAKTTPVKTQTTKGRQR